MLSILALAVCIAATSLPPSSASFIRDYKLIESSRWRYDRDGECTLCSEE